MKNDLTRVNQTVTNAVSDLNRQMDKCDGRMKEEFSNLNDTINRINDHVEKHENRMITELIDQNLQMIKLQQLSIYSCGGTGGWRRVVYT